MNIFILLRISETFREKTNQDISKTTWYFLLWFLLYENYVFTHRDKHIAGMFFWVLKMT